MDYGCVVFNDYPYSTSVHEVRFSSLLCLTTLVHGMMDIMSCWCLWLWLLGHIQTDIFPALKQYLRVTLVAVCCFMYWWDRNTIQADQLEKRACTRAHMCLHTYAAPHQMTSCWVAAKAEPGWTLCHMMQRYILFIEKGCVFTHRANKCLCEHSFALWTFVYVLHVSNICITIVDGNTH